MLGKRPRPIMRRTSSVSLIGSGSVNGESSPLSEHPKERQKSSNCTPQGSSASAPRQVIGFHPKVFIDEDLDLSAPISPHPPQSRSPIGSPRSGLGDLLSGSRPWDRKEEGVGLGIVVALSSSQEDVVKGREDARGFAVPAGYGRKTSPQHQLPLAFATYRVSPPTPIHAITNSGYHCPAHCLHQNCGISASGLHSGRQELILADSGHRGGGSSSSTATWSRPNVNGGTPIISWGQQADMEVDRNEPLFLAPPTFALPRPATTTHSTVFTQNFLDACHLCRRRLGEGRDIYIYRGDRAFCSPECRHQQIVNDERPEKCSSAVMKMGGADARNTGQRSRVLAAGTAAAA